MNGLGLGCARVIVACCAVVCTYMSADCMYASVCLSICYLLRVLFLHLSFVLAITKLSAGTAQVLHRLPAQVQGAEYLWYLHPAEQPSFGPGRSTTVLGCRRVPCREARLRCGRGEVRGAWRRSGRFLFFRGYGGPLKAFFCSGYFFSAKLSATRCSAMEATGETAPLGPALGSGGLGLG